jgi:RES domain-containing protein
MMPLPAALGGTGLTVWRLESDKHLPTWDLAEGAFLVGGRWSSPGRRVLYTSLDPATTILEVAVHKGFNVLDTVPHKLLTLNIVSVGVHIVEPSDIPNPNWLRPGTISLNQQKFGDALLDQYPLVVLPSVVSTHSWNLMINLLNASGLFTIKDQESFALDPRLTPGVHP